MYKNVFKIHNLIYSIDCKLNNFFLGKKQFNLIQILGDSLKEFPFSLEL